jgi:uncharacterized membrane protein YphA (DoxX/SURF4 family)
MKTVKSFIPAAARIVLGLLFTVFGLNYFLNLFPMPPAPPAGGTFLGALAATGYMFPLIKGTELLAGLLLLSGRFVPLALALLAPVLVNIFAYHAAFAPAGIGMAAVLLALELYLAWAYRAAFRPMLRASVAAQPAGTTAPSGRPLPA